MAAKPGPSNAGPLPVAVGSGPSNTTTQEYIVRVLKDRKKKLAMMKFSQRPGVDFSKVTDLSVKMERENNLKEYKTANDLDMMPKFGAGSEYGRDQKEEARRKKYGIILKKYNPDEQPWHLKVGSGKQAKKFRGVREGTITDNTSYYIFTQCADGAFEATPVEEWYNFTPMIAYKYLNSDEAEEEFSRRDKTLNYFNIMLKKRVKNEEKDPELDDEEKAAKKASKTKKKTKDFMLTDMDEWMDVSDDDEDGEDGDDEDEEKKDEGNEKPGKGKKSKGNMKGKGKVKNSKQNSDDEAIEESDEGDYDDREVDYMSDSSSSGVSEPEDTKKKYEEKGVAEEDGLRNILNSEDEDDEEENKEEDENEEEEKKEEEKPKEKKAGGGDTSSSSSGSDSDIDKDEKITSALLMQRGDKKKPTEKAEVTEGGAADTTDSKVAGTKRKAEGDAPPAKKSKKDNNTAPPPSSSASDGITEESIRRYLQRKPMTTKDLLQKFRSKKLNLTNDQMTHAIAQMLKRINPERITINKKLYLSLKKAD